MHKKKNTKIKLINYLGKKDKIVTMILQISIVPLNSNYGGWVVVSRLPSIRNSIASILETLRI